MRGSSLPIWWPDEFAFIKFNKVLYEAASPAISTISRKAEEQQKPHGKIISTTPNNIDSEQGAFCKKMIDDACEFIETMYDWSRDQIISYMNENSSNDFLYIVYHWWQLGLDQDWYRKMCRELNNNKLIIRREVDLEWTKSSDNSVFDEAQLDEIFQNVRSSIGTHIINIEKFNHETAVIKKIPYSFTLYEELIPDKVYFIGSDVSGGLSRDYSTLVITDPAKDFKPVAIFKNKTINTNYFSTLCYVLIKHYLKNSVLFIENNSYGKAILDNLVTTDIEKNIYFEYKVSDKDRTTTNLATVTDSISYGINTNPTSRQLMFDILTDIVNDEPNNIVATELYEDIKGLVYSKSGKIEHDTTSHDDVLMGYLMVRYAVRHGNNIAKFLRNVTNVAKNIRDLLVSTSKNATPGSNATNDPAINKGIETDFGALVNMVMSGVDPSDAIITLNKKNIVTERRINKTLINQLLK